jgi:hypothetical protein
MKRFYATLRIGLCGFAVLALSGLWGCNKNPDEKPAGQRTEAALPSKDTVVNPVSPDAPTPTPVQESDMTGRISEQENYGIGGVHRIPWENKPAILANPVPNDSVYALTQVFQSLMQGYDSLLSQGPEYDSIQNALSKSLDFRECGGSGNFSTLDKRKMDSDLVFGSAPKPGLTYQILGKGGALMREPLRFDSMMAKIHVDRDNVVLKEPVWRATSADSGFNQEIRALGGSAFVLGSKNLIRNPAVEPVAIGDSLKLFILKSIFPDESLLRLFSRIDFYSAGGDATRKRCVVSFTIGEGSRGNDQCVVEVADGKCTVLFRLTHDPLTLEWLLSLTESPIADVFVFRFYEVRQAILKKDGKWVGVYFEYNDPHNWGC